MYIFFCEHCSKLDAFKSKTGSFKCPDCGREYLALEVTVEEWNELSNDEMLDRIEKAKKPVEIKSPVFKTSPADNSADSEDAVRTKIMNVVKPVICSQLKSPASARFPEELISISGDDERGYRVEGFVDSQNSYGAMLRNDFSADVKIEDGFPKVVNYSVAARANVQRAKQFGLNYIAISIFTLIGGAALYFLIRLIVGM